MKFLDLVRPLRSKEVREIQQGLLDYYGVSLETEYAWFLHTKENDVFLMSRDVQRVPFDTFRIMNMGLYVGQMHGAVLRLSIEGAQLVKPVKHVLEIPDEFTKWYLYGDDVNLEASGISLENGWHVVRTSRDVLGCGLVKDGMLLNYTPKGRRISSKD